MMLLIGRFPILSTKSLLHVAISDKLVERQPLIGLTPDLNATMVYITLYKSLLVGPKRSEGDNIC